MRIPSTPLLCLLLAASCVLAPRPAHAEDAPPSAAAAADLAAAAQIGRDLLARGESVRTRAVARLLARIERGGDLERFLDAMSKGAQAWADRNERLMEVWLERAVHGNAAEREEAVKLLAALGTHAIRRLAEELRHARQQRGAARPAPPKDDEPAAAEDARPAPERAAGTPRIYDLTDLLARGMNPVEIRSLLQKAPDAVDVRPIKGGRWVVTALDRGHAVLLMRLEDLRTSMQALDEARAKPVTNDDGAPAPEAPPRKGPAAAPTASGPTPVRPDHDKPAPLPPAEAAKVRSTPTAGATDGLRRWHARPAIYHIPRTALAARDGGAQGDGPFPAGLATERTEVHAGTAADLATWARALQRVPDASQDVEPVGSSLFGGPRTATLFAGKSRQYARAVRQTKGGAWTIVMDTIPHGIGLEVAAEVRGDRLRIDLVATHTEVGLPVPVVTVRPAPDAAPVDLERPEWSTTRAQADFTLPLAGGGAMVSLGGLGSAPDDHIVVLLAIEPAAPSPAARK